MPDHVRVKDKETGHEFSVPSVRYEAEPDLYTKVDKPATDPAGNPLPPRYKTTVAALAAEKKAASTATDKENR